MPPTVSLVHGFFCSHDEPPLKCTCIQKMIWRWPLFHTSVHDASWKLSNDGVLNECKATLKYFVYIAEVDVWIKCLTVENEHLSVCYMMKKTTYPNTIIITVWMVQIDVRITRLTNPNMNLDWRHCKPLVTTYNHSCELCIPHAAVPFALCHQPRCSQLSCSPSMWAAVTADLFEYNLAHEQQIRFIVNVVTKLVHNLLISLWKRGLHEQNSSSCGIMLAPYLDESIRNPNYQVFSNKSSASNVKIHSTWDRDAFQNGTEPDHDRT